MMMGHINGHPLRYAQQGVISVTVALFLGGMLTFFSFVLLVIVMSTTNSRLSMMADAVLYSSSDSHSAHKDATQMVQANTDKPTPGLKQTQLELSVGESKASARLTGTVAADELLLSDELGYTDVVISRQAQSRLHQTTVEIAIMLDVSDSMSGKPMTQAIKGLRDFADILYAEERRNYSKTISIVPATGLVNIGWRPHFFKPSATRISRYWKPLAKEQGWKNWLDEGVPGRWRRAMCPQLPEVADKLNNASSITPDWIRRLELPPDQQQLRFYLEHKKRPAVDRYANGMPLQEFFFSGNRPPDFYPYWKDKRALFDSPDCGVSSIQALMSNRRAFIKALKTLYPEFSTNNAEGVMWAWRLLSPEWRGQWDKKKHDLPRDYGLEHNHKVMVLFTDGEHSSDVAKRDRKQAALCREMKRQGIEIISVDFNNRSRVVKSCASPGKYYSANNRTIRTVLKQVATTINKIELVK